MQLYCDSCYRTSPAHDGAPEHAQAWFRGLGWTWRADSRQVCPICSSREKTIPPPALDDEIVPAAE
jgi:hypothetical protein